MQSRYATTPKNMNVHHHDHSLLVLAMTVLLNFNIHAECLQTNLPFVIHSHHSLPYRETQQWRRLSRFSTFAITNCDSEYDYESSKSIQHKKISSSQPDDDDNPLVVTDYTPGKPHGYFIVQKYNVPAQRGFPNLQTCGLFQEADIQRLGLTPTNVTLPSALVLLDPDRYPDIQSSLRASRDGSILIQRSDFDVDGGSTGSPSSDDIVDVSKCKRGRVGDRIFPNDTLYRQERMMDAGASEQWCRSYARSKNDTSLLGNVNVVYEDDHMAIVNKPGGVEIFQHSPKTQDDDGASSSSSSRSSGENSMKELLPFALRPPTRGVVADVLAIPEAAHRLDKPTSGLLLVAKTRPSLRHLSAQFQGLGIEKTYTAICYGTPKATPHGRRESVGPIEMHQSEDDDNNLPLEENQWQSTDVPLDGKSAITHWRVLKNIQHNNTQLSLLELKPKTGRYRQLRRHMAKIHGCPLVGDTVFAKGIEKGNNRYLGLFLCSSAVRFEHPCYGASSDIVERNRNAAARLSSDGSSGRVTFRSEGDRLMVEASIELPRHFADLLEN